MSAAENDVIQFIEAYFSKQSEFDGQAMLEFWQPGGRLFLVGNNNEFRVVSIEDQVSHLKEAKERLPDLTVDFNIEEFEQVVVHEELIASLHLRYRMTFPEGYGKHRCFFNLARITGEWKIVNVVDRGFQVLPADGQ